MTEPSTSDSRDPYSISTVRLDDDRYEIKQPAIRNKYIVRDSAGEVVLRGKQKMLKMKEEFPFLTGDGADAFTVKAGGIMDVAGNYTLTDAGTGEDVVVLDEEFSLLSETWRIRDPDSGRVLATIRSKNKLLSALRHLVEAANLVPNKYEVVDPDENHVGDIDGQFSLRDIYTASTDDATTIPKEVMIATACVLDALENK